MAANKMAYITQWPTHWNDEQDPTIKIVNPSGSSARIIAGYIAFDGSPSSRAYRVVESRTPSITLTFKLTDDEKKGMYERVTGKTTHAVSFIVRTSFVDNPTDADWQYSVKNSTFEIVNCQPEIDLSVISIRDINDDTFALTGNREHLVLNASTAEVTMPAKANKGGTLTKRTVSCGDGRSISLAESDTSATFDKVGSSTFTLTAEDNRMQGVSAMLQYRNVIGYIPLSCSQRVNIELESIESTSAIAKLAISGDYYKGSFGAKNNNLELWYRIMEAGEGWSSELWSTLELDGWQKVDAADITYNQINIRNPRATYSTHIEKADLDPSKRYVFQCRAIDAVYTGEGVLTTEYFVKLQPTFDWSNDDFNFNVPVTIMGSPITPSANRYIYSTPGIAGSSGYIKMARLTHRKANADTPITFVFTRRLEASPMTVHVQFKSDSTTADPDLKTITYEGSNYGAFIVRVATSVWDLYVQKVSAYDTVTLHTWFSSGTVDDRLTVEFPGDLASALPSGLNNEGYYRATPIVLKSILDCFMPVGFVLTLYSKANPNDMYPGTTWERIQNTFLWGCDESGTIGQTGGEKTHTLTVNEIPAHSHELPINYGSNAGTRRGVDRWNDSASLYSDNVYTTKTVGGGAAHNNMPPYTQVSIWRRTA